MTASSGRQQKRSRGALPRSMPTPRATSSLAPVPSSVKPAAQARGIRLAVTIAPSHGRRTWPPRNRGTRTRYARLGSLRLYPHYHNLSVSPDLIQGQKITLRVYRCGGCEGCPLADRCVSAKSQGGRTISRDIYTMDRERHAAKMRTPEARARYGHRFHAGETPFGWLKHVLGLRQFLLRGLEKVRMEWLWACTGYNLRKLIGEVTRLRAAFTRLSTEAVN